jgi:hypothetical protein
MDPNTILRGQDQKIIASNVAPKLHGIVLCDTTGSAWILQQPLFTSKADCSGNMPLVRIDYSDISTLVGRKSCYIKRHKHAYEYVDDERQNLLGVFERNAD